uniref:DUF1659 domain-containing protein n=1 Tax=Dictyoglomus thermophilum TaxID=14 RepID=A0A7V3ZJK2_DICTH
MAVQSFPRNSQIVLRLSEDGIAFRYLRINNIKYDASDQDVYDVAVAIGGLQKYPVVNVIRTNDEELVEV